MDASPTCTSEELQVFDRWIERIHDAAQTGTFIMVITQGSLQPAKPEATQSMGASCYQEEASTGRYAIDDDSSDDDDDDGFLVVG